MSHRKQHAAALGWFALVAACVFWKVVLLQEVLYWGDIMLYFLPMTTFARSWLVQGVLPLWNPHILFGQPYVGNPQEWLFYPSTFLLLFVHPARYLAWNTVIHLWLGAVGMWLFLRALKVNVGGALLGSTAWMLCGAFVPRAQFHGMFQTIALIGWLMWATERLTQRAHAGTSALFAGVLAFVWLAGHAQAAYMASLIAVGWLLWRWYTQGKPSRLLWFAVGGAVVGLLLSAVHWLPMVQLLRETPRVNLSVWGADRFALRPEQWLLLLQPALYGTPWEGNWLGRGNYWEVACAVGILPVMAAITAWRVRAEARFWLIVAGISFWLAMGPSAGLYFVAYYTLPGIKAFHDPARWLILTNFALCVSAAMGWEGLRFSRRWLWLTVALLVFSSLWVWLGDDITRWAAQHDTIRASRPEAVPSDLVASAHATAVSGWRRTIVVAVLTLLLLRLTSPLRVWAVLALLLFELLPFATFANPTCVPAVFARPPASAQTVGSRGGRLLVIDQVPMWRKYVSYVDYGSNSPAYLRRWQEMLGSNIGMMWALSEASGYEPVAVKSSVRYYLQLAQGCKRNPGGAPVLRAFQRAGIIAVATGSSADDWRVSSLPIEAGRAWALPSKKRLFVRDVSPQHLSVLDVPAGTCVLSDTAYPGWKAQVDGKPTAYTVHDTAFRKIHLASPATEVRWRYEPDTFRVGLYLSLLACAVVTGISIFTLAKGKAPHTTN